MFTPSPSYLWPVEVVLGDGAARTTAKVIDVANPVANVGFQTLIVAGHHQTAQGAPGKWYWISGIGAERDACQSGEWDAAADQDSSGNFTEFTLPSEAYVSDFQVGWLLQPDINVPVYLPITSANNGTITVSGSYGSLAPSSSGTHFRIYAPPGVERTGPFYSGFEAGTLSRFTSASSSRNLFGGYRYESPLAGVRDDLWMAVQGRQSGKNFTGLHYTLHRHYDPHLMRFTSTDPAAAPFFNLYAYCQGNPSRFFDPDGLDINTNATGCRLSPEDEEYFARSAGRTAALMDAMNCFGLFDRTKAAMRDQKSFSEVAGTFSNEVATTDWRTVTTSHFYNGANTLSGGWMGEVLDAETVAGWTGAKVNSREWRAGAASGSFAATTAAMLNPYSAMTVGLLTMTHGGYLAARIAAGDDSIDPFHANAEMFGGAAMFMGGRLHLELQKLRRSNNPWKATPKPFRPRPEVIYHRSDMPQICENIAQAQRVDQLSVLSRMEGKSLIKAQRRAACRGLTAGAANMSLDEYPFASTYQGGAGSRVRAVPIAEQQIQAGLMSVFYKRHGIKDGMAFRVRVKP